MSEAIGPDLTLGVVSTAIMDNGRVLGHVGAEAVLLVRCGAEFFAVGAHCTHYHGPLADGIVVDGTVRCPWHHACFDLRTGEALRAPALSAIDRWAVEQRDGKIFVTEKLAPQKPKPRSFAANGAPKRIVVIGGGAAGFAAVEMLRREQYQGGIVMVSDDDAPPVDRPNLSKDYLAGAAPEDWLPLRAPGFYSENGIDLRLKTKAIDIDVASREIALDDGSKIAYDRLLLATGAEARRLSIPGSDQAHVRTLRTLSDCRTVIRHANAARRAVVIGASFIGLEVAAALRARGLGVHVVAPEKRPMERILGSHMGDFIRALHEEHGVVFHLDDTPAAIDGKDVKLARGMTLEADLVVAGIGVRPRTDLAERAGLAMDGGVLANAYLESSAPNIFIAGDIARWADAYSGERVRVEHWVVAERQGQTAARNMLGYGEKFSAVPFFWSQHYDVPINYVGHARGWDELAIEGDAASKDCVVRFRSRGRTLAVASIFRDIESLQAELAMERRTMV